MRRWLPSLPLSAALLGLWLLLNDSIAPADLLLGAIVALLAPALVAPLKPRGPRLRRPLVLARLVLRVGGDVVVSALEVAGGVLRAHQKVHTAHGDGEITSGTFSPTMKQSIALARLPIEIAVGDTVHASVRDRQLAARVVKPPFVRNGRSLID